MLVFMLPPFRKAVTAISSFLARRKISSDSRKSRRVNNSRCRVSRRLQSFIALPQRIESYILAAMQIRSTCIHAPRRFRARAIIAFARAAARAVRRHCRCARNRAAAAIAVVRRAVPARADRKNLCRQQDLRRCSREIRARRNRAQIRSAAATAEGFSLRQFVGENFVSPGFRGERIQDRAARGDPRARRQAVGRTDASAAIITRREFAASTLELATWCPEGAFARCTTGIPISRWWVCRPADATISWPTWSRTSPGSSIGMGTSPTAAAAIT